MAASILSSSSKLQTAAFKSQGVCCARSPVSAPSPLPLPWLQLAQRQLSLTAQAAPSQASSTPPTRASGPKKKNKKMIDVGGEITKDVGNGMFQVKLENGVNIIAYMSGKIQQNRIKLLVGDSVTVELSPYDLSKGRITYRHKAGEKPSGQQ